MMNLIFDGLFNGIDLLMWTPIVIWLISKSPLMEEEA